MISLIFLSEILADHIDFFKNIIYRLNKCFIGVNTINPLFLQRNAFIVNVNEASRLRSERFDQAGLSEDGWQR
jgi:hypothetical protein